MNNSQVGTEANSNQKGLTGTGLKLIAISSMLIDHMGAVGEEYVFTTFAQLCFFLMRLVGRLAFPIFIFLLVEGFAHTRSVIKYARNLLIFAIISEVPFNLVFYSGKIWTFEGQNVYFTLLFGLMAMLITDKAMKKDFTKGTAAAKIGITIATALLFAFLGRASDIAMLFEDFGGRDFFFSPLTILTIVCMIAGFITGVVVIKKTEPQKLVGACISLFAVTAICVAAEFLHTDYGAYGVAAIMVMYLFRKTKVKGIRRCTLALIIMSPFEAFALFDMLFVNAYNGRRGAKIKYLFYGFYPVHLLALFLLAKFFLIH